MKILSTLRTIESLCEITITVLSLVIPSMTCRTFRITPHVAQRRDVSAIDGRTTRHPGYSLSQRARKRVEEIFGWLKTVGGLRKTRYRGVRRVGWMFTFATAVYNLVRIRNLLEAVG